MTWKGKCLVPSVSLALAIASLLDSVLLTQSRSMSESGRERVRGKEGKASGWSTASGAGGSWAQGTSDDGARQRRPTISLARQFLAAASVAPGSRATTRAPPVPPSSSFSLAPAVAPLPSRGGRLRRRRIRRRRGRIRRGRSGERGGGARWRICRSAVGGRRRRPSMATMRRRQRRACGGRARAGRPIQPAH